MTLSHIPGIWHKNIYFWWLECVCVQGKTKPAIIYKNFEMMMTSVPHIKFRHSFLFSSLLRSLILYRNFYAWQINIKIIFDQRKTVICPRMNGTSFSLTKKKILIISRVVFVSWSRDFTSFLRQIYRSVVIKLHTFTSLRDHHREKKHCKHIARAIGYYFIISCDYIRKIITIDIIFIMTHHSTRFFMDYFFFEYFLVFRPHATNSYCIVKNKIIIESHDIEKISLILTSRKIIVKNAGKRMEALS